MTQFSSTLEASFCNGAERVYHATSLWWLGKFLRLASLAWPVVPLLTFHFTNIIYNFSVLGCYKEEENDGGEGGGGIRGSSVIYFSF